ncbi:MAG: RNA methyltransferase [Nitrospinota bacterium]
MKRKNRIYAALVHYPVLNKRGEIVATSITTIDLHDMARISTTYGVDKFYAVTPLKAQHKLVGRILNHWMSGFGAEYNSSRKQAFERLMVTNDIDEALEDIEESTGMKTTVIVTAARSFDNSVSYDKIVRIISEANEENFLVLFGTGWGLSDEVVNRADYILKPIDGGTEYNHLPVRGAFAIILDRLLGR